jgi:O-glycosyl hydrolase
MKMKWNMTALTVMALAAVLVFSACLGGAEDKKPDIVRPYFSIQPQGASFFTDAYEPKALTVEVWDWDAKDGSLSYQWYSFTDIEDYCNNRNITTISGQGGAVPEAVPVNGVNISTMTYTPTVTPEAGKQFFYYVVITNNNSDTDEGRASTGSEVAAISFSEPNTALFPVITRHPVSATYGWGAALGELKVDASLPANADGFISYQWFSNQVFSVKDGTAVALANQSSMMPDYDSLNLGDRNRFFATVTNTYGASKAIAYSIPATVTIEPGRRAASPRIDSQPGDQLYFIGESISDMEIKATSVDRGSISYQWFSNTTNSSKGGTAIDRATGNKYKPPVSTAGNYFYYVEVTNTNNNVREDKTAKVTSKAVQISIAASAAADEAANAFVTIPDPSAAANRYQYIRGYGGMDVAWGNFPRTNPVDTELMYDPDRMGYNILRIMIRADNVDVEKTVKELIATDRPAYYENVQIVNKYGGYVLASPWTPPKEWKSNNSINGGGHLIPAYYKLFANYLRNFAQHMSSNGAPIYAISISNEPNYVAGYDGCEWEPEEMRDFFLEVGHFTTGIRGYGGGKETPYVLTMNGESANTPNINLAALRDPKAKSYIDLLARHVYGEREVSLWNTATSKPLLQKADGSYFEVWMTEHNINSANATGYLNDSTWNYVWRYMNDVDLVIRINNENAFVWWASKRFYSMVGDGQMGTVDGKPYPRGWGLSHYARFSIDSTRIKAVVHAADNTPAYTPVSRIYNASGTAVTLPHADRNNSIVNLSKDDMDNLSPRITAFVSADGNEISMVLWTPTTTSGSGGYSLGTVKINLPDGFIARSATSIRSWGHNDNQMFQMDSDVAGQWKAIRLSADRKSAYVDVPRSQILSVKFTR